MSGKKYVIVSVIFATFLLLQAVQTLAVTVYFQDGTQMEVESMTRVGDTVCLFVDISAIDTTRTEIQDLQHLSEPEKALTSLSGLNLENIDFSPSEDDRDIIATGEVVNRSAYPVRDIRVIVTLKDKEARKLLTIQGYVRPGRLEPGQKGSYRLQVQKPQGFWKAGIDVQGEAVK